VLSGFLASLLAVAAPAFAASPIAAKRAEAEQVFAQVKQLNVSLGVADEKVNLANLQLARVKNDLAVNEYELAVAEHNLARSQKAIAQRLVNLYTSPQTSTLEVILGSSSLDDMLTQVDNANKISSLDTQVLSQVYSFKGAVKRHERALVRARAATRRLLAERAAEERAIAAQLAQRRQLLSSIQGEIARLEAEQRARELELARQAQARMMQAQATAQQDSAASVVGAFAATPETGAVLPP